MGHAIIKNKKKGMTIFVAVIVTSILLFISFAVINITLKGTLFASSGRDSQYAFYAADAGIECALYFDSVMDSFNPAINGNYVNCGGVIDSPHLTKLMTGGELQGTSTTAIIGGDASALTGANISPVSLAFYQTEGAPASAQTNTFDAHANSVIVVGISFHTDYGIQVASVTDSAGNTYIPIVSDASSGLKVYMWYAKNENAYNNNRITVTLTWNAWFLNIAAAEYTGLDFASPLYDWADSIDTGLPTSYTNTFDVPDKGLAVAFFTQDKTFYSGSYSWTAGPDYNERIETLNGISMLQDRFYSANQSNISTSATSPGSNPVPKASVVAVFRGDLNAASLVESRSFMGFVFDKMPVPVPYCSLVTVYKSGGGTNIKSRGYNTCDANNSRRIERGIELSY